jgi:hypothetical protein
VKETIAGGRGQQYMQDLHKCPLHYERIPYEDIRCAWGIMQLAWVTTPYQPLRQETLTGNVGSKVTEDAADKRCTGR